MSQVVQMLLRPQMVSRDRLHKINGRFCVSNLNTRSSYRNKWGMFTGKLISLSLSERGSFDSIRTSVVRLAYPKSVMFFMQFILCHLFGLLLHAVLVNIYLLY